MITDDPAEASRAGAELSVVARRVRRRGQLASVLASAPRDTPYLVHVIMSAPLPTDWMRTSGGVEDRPGATIRRTVAEWPVRKEPDYQLQYRFGGWWTRLPPASEHARGIHGTAAGEQQELARKPPAGCMRGSQRLGLLR